MRFILISFVALLTLAVLPGFAASGATGAVPGEYLIVAKGGSSHGWHDDGHRGRGRGSDDRHFDDHRGRGRGSDDRHFDDHHRGRSSRDSEIEHRSRSGELEIEYRHRGGRTEIEIEDRR